MSEPIPSNEWLSEQEAAFRSKRLSRRSFLVAAASGVAAFSAWEWIRTRPTEDGIPWPLRKALKFNEGIAGTLSSSSILSKEFPLAAARMPKANGVIGLDDAGAGPGWKLNTFGLASPDTPIALTLDDIRKLPRVDIVTELKCIEGWSEIVHWTGARISDLVARFPVATPNASLLPNPGDLSKAAKYLAAETPDGEYYVGLDMKSALHPQTLLCYEMNGAPLENIHGAPLRLAVPIKYGIKNLKCVGELRFTNERPPDYWAEQGYDYYAGF